MLTAAVLGLRIKRDWKVILRDKRDIKIVSSQYSRGDGEQVQNMCKPLGLYKYKDEGVKIRVRTSVVVHTMLSPRR